MTEESGTTGDAPEAMEGDASGGSAEGSSPRARYEERAGESRRAAIDAEARLRRLGTLRGATFAGAIVAWIVGDLVDLRAVGLAAAAVGAWGFLLLVRRHRATRLEVAQARASEDWATSGLARLDRRWDDLPSPEAMRDGEPADLSGHPYAIDLDLFGHASLASLLGPAYTPRGVSRLHSFLLEPPPPGALTRRQEAIRELATDWAQRERTHVAATVTEASAGTRSESRGFESFLEWCSASGSISPALSVAAWVLPVLTLGAMVADLAGPWPAWPWAALAVVQAILALRQAAALHEDFDLASAGVPGLQRVSALLEAWEGHDASADLTGRAVAALGQNDESGSRALRRLERLQHLGDLRLSSLYPVFAVLLMWDVHVARRLLRWRAEYGSRVEAWMDALATLEAVSSMATLAADHPEWCWPVDEGSGAGEAPEFVAAALGHPLLAGESRVPNDVRLGPPGSVLLVTGSNMSGKSTLLRAIGLSVVMARAGLPACARELRLPDVRLFTSMRVQDSLEAGVSFFMAELLRLKALLDAAPTAPPIDRQSDEEPMLLYLVDEILQGTNSHERREAGRRLIRHLLRRRAIGAVTTHDLGFHEHPELEARADLVHFRESLEGAGAGLSFDYMLRPGLATTRNALRLAERVGLTEPGADGSP